tara:strand:+ start:8013 stop:8867 length:855 start_codon:yes stop_codon:yes gene_type:complete
MAVGVSNNTGTTQTADYNLGRGIIFISPLDTTTGLPVDYRDLGNAPSFSLSIDVEELVHQSSRGGLRTVDKRLVISQTVNFSFVLEELSAENLALFFSGATVTSTNPAIAGITAYTLTASAVLGRWYSIYNQTTGARALDIDSAMVAITEDPGGTPVVMTLDADYTVDAEMGMIFIMPGGTIVAGDELQLVLTADAGAAVTTQTRGLTSSGVDYAMKFVGENPADNDQRFEVELHSVQVNADGDFSLISESDLTQMPFTGTAQQNASWLDSNSKTMTLTSYDKV